MSNRPIVVGVLLAGGQSRRMGGGDKCLRPLSGRPILAHVIERIRPQVDQLILNANGDSQRFSDFDLPVVPDVIEGFAGPLAGVLSGLEWARRHQPQAAFAISVPTDGPFLPMDLVDRMLLAIEDENADLACAASSGRSHPVVGLWPLRLAEDLRHAVTVNSIRKVDEWTAGYRLATVNWPTGDVDPFFNTNRPDDLATAERLLA